MKISQLMKSTGYHIYFLLMPLLILSSCAKRGSPDGGPRDEEPPRYIRASPENFSTGFQKDEIRIYFDEYVKLQDAQNQIIISPPMDPRPEITPLGTASKSVRIRINDTLRPSTTYAFNFGRSIVDNNEENPLNFFKYVFSTGSYIDSLSVSGQVSDAYLMKPDPFISVMLYEVDSAYSDSVVYKQPPMYITNTLDSLTSFQLDNLKEGTYKLVALKDNNNNYRFDPGSEKIAFLEEHISVPTDSVYDLTLFREEGKFTVSRPTQQAGQHLIFGYEGEVEQDSINVSTISSVPEDFSSRITRDRETDTLHYWYKPAIEGDSLQFLVEGPQYKDTLLTRLRTIDRDSLQISFDPSGTVGFEQNISIFFNIPLVDTDASLITLTDSDTVTVSFTSRYEEFDNKMVLEFEKEESQSYNFEALPGAFTDFFGTMNDTIQATFRTQTLADFGNLNVNLQKVEEYPIIVQLATEDGKTKAEEYATQGTSFTFQHIKPGKYLLRVILDSNSNGSWDSGNYLEEQQPEEVIYYPEVLDIRANWDDTYLFIVE